jgi:hypothetical protein
MSTATKRSLGSPSFVCIPVLVAPDNDDGEEEEDVVAVVIAES